MLVLYLHYVLAVIRFKGFVQNVESLSMFRVIQIIDIFSTFLAVPLDNVSFHC